MLSCCEAEQGMEAGMRAMASTSSMLHTSILLYTYLRTGMRNFVRLWTAVGNDAIPACV